MSLKDPDQSPGRPYLVRLIVALIFVMLTIEPTTLIHGAPREIALERV